MNNNKLLFQIKYTICFILFLTVGANFSCRNNFDPEKITFEEAKNNLPLYYNFLDYLKKDGFNFINFHEYWNSEWENLPEKLIVLRHDIHEWDIKEAYYTYFLENDLLGGEVGTYYVRFDDPKEISRLGNNKYRELHARYLELIDFLKKRNVDVQPHISPCDMYVYDQNPSWKNLSADSLKLIVNANYDFNYSTNGLEIQVRNSDVLNIEKININLTSLLMNYNNNWLSSTGLEVESYAAHGSDIALNLALGNVRLLNQTCLLQSNLYEFETTSNIIKTYLNFIHDTYRPDWIENPSLIESDRYELLIHPDNWIDPQYWRDTYGGANKSGSIKDCIHLVNH